MEAYIMGSGSKIKCMGMGIIYLEKYYFLREYYENGGGRPIVGEWLEGN